MVEKAPQWISNGDDGVDVISFRQVCMGRPCALLPLRKTYTLEVSERGLISAVLFLRVKVTSSRDLIRYPTESFSKFSTQAAI